MVPRLWMDINWFYSSTRSMESLRERSGPYRYRLSQDHNTPASYDAALNKTRRRNRLRIPPINYSSVLTVRRICWTIEAAAHHATPISH
ncbi:hypothetical protein BDQ94DRAFT_133409 [Aspergillus welwitschiae]|uniref:Uncharacterized protein n=1 Tax=Aspergillus welwitschiae TaxID=1341132 RepID=A0A3F3QLK2_9EURO|nr:hypothetical protein BDQ94DRAFT_133409 [Aspergillus welwitschiae]RDH39636.1 hypothetical protein BDQ94DRAFT_133409 [Aspergillus welwitschiae]